MRSALCRQSCTRRTRRHGTCAHSDAARTPTAAPNRVMNHMLEHAADLAAHAAARRYVLSAWQRKRGAAAGARARTSARAVAAVTAVADALALVHATRQGPPAHRAAAPGRLSAARLLPLGAALARAHLCALARRARAGVAPLRARVAPALQRARTGAAAAERAAGAPACSSGGPAVAGRGGQHLRARGTGACVWLSNDGCRIACAPGWHSSTHACPQGGCSGRLQRSPHECGMSHGLNGGSAGHQSARNGRCLRPAVAPQKQRYWVGRCASGYAWRHLGLRRAESATQRDHAPVPVLGRRGSCKQARHPLLDAQQVQ